MKVPELSTFFQITDQQRCCFVGKTGSGKTQLAKRLCLEFNSVLILDFKHTIRIPGIEITSDPARLKNLGVEFPHIIFRIPYEWEAEQLDALFKWAFTRENTLVYIDEGYSVGTASSFPKWLKIIAVQGREKHVALWTLFQRPRGVPVFLVSEAEHLFVFYLNRPEDRQYIEEMAESRIDWDAINPKKGGAYKFFHIQVGEAPQGPYRIKEIP